MAMCVKPGCVSEAKKGRDSCPIHESGAGKRCDACFGSGYIHWRADSDKRDPCDRCGGTGLKDARRNTRRVNPEPDPVDDRPLMVAARTE